MYHHGVLTLFLDSSVSYRYRKIFEISSSATEVSPFLHLVDPLVIYHSHHPFKMLRKKTSFSTMQVLPSNYIDHMTCIQVTKRIAIVYKGEAQSPCERLIGRENI